MSHWGLKLTQDVHFSFLTHTKQLLLLTFCDTAAETEVSFGHTDGNGNGTGRTDGQTDVEVEIVI